MRWARHTLFIATLLEPLAVPRAIGTHVRFSVPKYIRLQFVTVRANARMRSTGDASVLRERPTFSARTLNRCAGFIVVTFHLPSAGECLVPTRCLLVPPSFIGLIEIRHAILGSIFILARPVVHRARRRTEWGTGHCGSVEIFRRSDHWVTRIPLWSEGNDQERHCGSRGIELHSVSQCWVHERDCSKTS